MSCIKRVAGPRRPRSGTCYIYIYEAICRVHGVAIAPQRYSEYQPRAGMLLRARLQLQMTWVCRR